MAKHHRVWNENQYRRYLSEGRGQGSMENYKPWVQIQDFPSKGIVSRVKGRTTGRVHHLMSNLELWYFYLLDWSEKTIDIREQYPLEDISDAIMVAEEAGIRYPYDPSSGFPYVMTSDFLITTEYGLVARAIKPTNELKKARVREKLEIERRYWQRRNVEWKLVTENEISRTKAQNIEWIFSGCNVREIITDKIKREECAIFFIECFKDESIPIIVIINNMERGFGLDKGIGITVFKMLLQERRVYIDLNESINLTKPRMKEAYG